MTRSSLDDLKALKRERGHGPLFPSHLEFQKWADQVAPLLVFDGALRQSFLHCAKLADSLQRSGSVDGSYESISRAVGLVNQAIGALELSAAQESRAMSSTSSAEKLKPPEKLTFKWLYEHAPLALYLWFGGLLVAAFALGLVFSETPLYALLKTTVNTPTELQTPPTPDVKR